MDGDKQGGFTIFWADDGLDTGPILLQKCIDVDTNETVDTLYNRFLYPEGIKGMVSQVFSFIQNVKRLWRTLSKLLCIVTYTPTRNRCDLHVG